SDRTCSAGACTCKGGLLDCGGRCIDPLVNDAFCGAEGDCSGPHAGTTCASDQSCLGGVCSCDPGLLFAGSFVDPASSNEFCGAAGECMGDRAGRTCADREVCQDGVCVGGDPSLTGLAFSEGRLDPAFTPETTDYTLTVSRSVDEVTVLATAAVGDASL